MNINKELLYTDYVFENIVICRLDNFNGRKINVESIIECIGRLRDTRNLGVITDNISTSSFNHSFVVTDLRLCDSEVLCTVTFLKTKKGHLLKTIYDTAGSIGIFEFKTTLIADMSTDETIVKDMFFYVESKN